MEILKSSAGRPSPKPKFNDHSNKEGYGISCLKCGAAVYSDDRHDFKWCPCQSVAVDGGYDYLKIVGSFGDWLIVDREGVPVARLNDWELHAGSPA